MAGKMPPAFLKNIKGAGKAPAGKPGKGGMPMDKMGGKKAAGPMMPAFKKGGKVGKGC